MNIRKREERNRKVVLYRLGLEDGIQHTLFESALKFDLSINQIYRIERDILTRIHEFLSDETQTQEEAAKVFGFTPYQVTAIMELPFKQKVQEAEG